MFDPEHEWIGGRYHERFMSHDSPHELWIFGYGSLMWRPGFPFEEKVRAQVPGYSRSFCIRSVHHRGVEGKPGLVLGLDRGGTCTGIAYRVSQKNAEQTLQYLREREQVNGVYREARLTISLLEGDRRQVFGLTYVAERAHPSYVSRMPLIEQARLIATSSGLSGQNVAFLVNTWAHLEDLGIRERNFERLATIIGSVVTGRRPVREPCPKAVALARALSTRRPACKTLTLCERRRFTYRKSMQRGAFKKPEPQY